MSVAPSSRTMAPLRALIQRNKPIIDITLKNEQEASFVSSFTTLDQIDGEVSITSPCEVDFHDIHITFQGSARTYVEKIATTAPTNGRTQALHNFLRLVQPIPDSLMPQLRILEAGRTYTFPFTFVVPERLLPQTCTHERDNQQVQEAHLSLPPSFGDPMVATDGKSLIDDLTPEMTVIGYALRVVITRMQDSTGKPSAVADSRKKIRVIPAVSELPPLSVEGDKDEDYTLRKEKDLKKGMFKGKLGRLTVEAAQPRSLRLPPVRSASACPITTMAVINVRFDPAEECAQPPKLGRLVNKLKVTTFYASAPMRDFPGKPTSLLYDWQRGVYTESLNLSSRCIASAQWQTHLDSSSTLNEIRRDSALSITSIVNNDIVKASSAYAGKKFYTARILVPIDLPTNKFFVPSFHSCLISRVYTLDLTLSAQTPGTSVSAPTMRLKVPLQITSEGNVDARAMISEEEAQAIAAREADDVFSPRSVAPPIPEYTEQAEITGPIRRIPVGMWEVMGAPPGYSMSVARRPDMEVDMERPVGITPACG